LIYFNKIKAVSKSSLVFQILAKFKNEKEVVLLRENKEIKCNLVDLVIYCYLNEILQNSQNCNRLVIFWNYFFELSLFPRLKNCKKTIII